MKSSTLKLIAFAALASSLIACAKKGSDGASVNARDDRFSGQMVTPMGQGSIGSVANIQFSSAQAYQMKEAVQVLVSPTLEPSAVGEINSVEVSGNIGFQSGSGQVTNDSAFQIVIRDSYVGQTEDGGVIEPITMRISNATGTVSNGQANVTFSDSYGTVTVTGRWDQSNTFTGVVSFQNRTAANGIAKTGGTLGSFAMPVCSLFRCLQ